MAQFSVKIISLTGSVLGENQQAQKIRKNKGLARKSLKCLSYWNRWGFGS
jgi:hypothetical protein